MISAGRVTDSETGTPDYKKEQKQNGDKTNAGIIDCTDELINPQLQNIA